MSDVFDRFPSLSSLLRQALGDALSAMAETFVDMVSDDVRFEFPFALPDGIRVLEGKKELGEYLPKIGSLITIESMSLSRAIRSVDGVTAVIEFSCKGHSKASGARYDQDYVSVLDLKDGRIARYRDYWNPLIAIAALGSAEEANAVLKGARHDG